MSLKRSKGKESEYSFFEGDGSSSDKMGIMGVAMVIKEEEGFNISRQKSGLSVKDVILKRVVGLDTDDLSISNLGILHIAAIPVPKRVVVVMDLKLLIASDGTAPLSVLAVAGLTAVSLTVEPSLASASQPVLVSTNGTKLCGMNVLLRYLGRIATTIPTLYK
ncbi:hypothetical protein Tco_1065844 [Tanacetum coccineum]